MTRFVIKGTEPIERHPEGRRFPRRSGPHYLPRMGDLRILLVFPVLIASIVLHELAHAWVARREGDRTAEQEGRITLNPIPHIDPLGSVVLPVALYYLGGLIFGWAKPVPVDPRNFRDPVWSDIKVSLAGVAVNLLLAVGCTLLLPVVLNLRGGVVDPTGSEALLLVQEALEFGIVLNLLLMVFNLIPIPPLDGSHVVAHLLPAGLADGYRRLGKYGLGLLMLLILFFEPLWTVLLWPVQLMQDWAYTFVGLWV